MNAKQRRYEKRLYLQYVQQMIELAESFEKDPQKVKQFIDEMKEFKEALNEK